MAGFAPSLPAMEPSADVDTDPVEYEIIARDTVPAPAPQPKASTQERMRELQQWLQPTDYLSPGGEFMKHLHSYLHGTGGCIRESPDFRKWIAFQLPEGDASGPPDTPRGCLHIRGVAGSGKSVFAASTIRQLRESHPGTPVLFFFFRQIVERNHDAKYLVRDYTSQLLPHSPILFSAVDLLARSTGVDGTETTALWDALVTAMRSMDAIFCVADALDEMDDECSGFVARLADLGTIKPASVKVLLTSRPVPKIEKIFRSPEVLRLKLDPMLLCPDVAHYIEARLSALSPRLSPKVEELTKNTICDRAQGLFLHGRLTTDNLTEGLRDGRITEATLPDSLEALPRSLRELYEVMLRDNARRSGVSTEQQVRILSCVTHSTRPLRLIELGSLAAHLIPGLDLRRGKEMVRASCGQLLEVLEDESVSVIHHSFTEFLNDSERASVEGVFPVVDASAANAMLAAVLLEYMSGCPLLKTDSQDGEKGGNESWSRRRGYTWDEQLKRQQAIEDIGISHPLIDYALFNLVDHLENSEAGPVDTIFSAIDKYFIAGEPAFALWMTRRWKRFMHSTVTPLHLAADSGWPGYCIRHLVVRSGRDLVDTRDEMERTALSYAVEEGRTEAVGVLLEHGADATAVDYTGYSILHYACQSNRAIEARLLLNAGASPLTARTKDSVFDRRYGMPSVRETPLSLACRSSNAELLDVFLPYITKADADLCFHHVKDAHHLEALLKTGLVSVNSYMDGQSALVRAIRRLDLESIKVLLKYGTDINRRSTCEFHETVGQVSSELTLPDRDSGATALHVFAGYDRGPVLYSAERRDVARQILELLLENGADINAAMDDRYQSGLTPLHCALRGNVQCGWEEPSDSQHTQYVVDLLLEAGADPNSRTNKGSTPLHLIRECSAGALGSLVRNGADLEAKNEYGRSPLLQLLFSSRVMETPDLTALEKLVDLGADVRAVDDSHCTVLGAFVHNLSAFANPAGTALLRKLVHAGADIKNLSLRKYGESSSWLDTDIDDEPIIKAMIDEGLDINLTDEQGETILHRVLRGCDVQIPTVEKYIRLGADPAVRTHSGSTLFYALTKVSPDWIKFLVSLGVDPLAPDASGNTLIHHLISNSWQPAFEADESIDSLVKAGLDPKAKNASGATALHLVKSSQSLDYILRSPWFAGLSVSDPDDQGETPLHIAAGIHDLMVKALLDRGASPDALTHEGLSPLHYAARPGRSNAVLLLLSWYKSHGVLERHLNLRDHREGWGYTPLQYACSVDDAESVRYLLSLGADPSILTSRGLYPLHTAVGWHPELATDHLKDVNDSRPFPPTPAEELETRRQRRARSTERGFYEPQRIPSLERDSRHIPIQPFPRTVDIVELLADSGADLHATFQRKNGQVLTPMDLALEAGNWVMARALAARGASPSSNTHAVAFEAAADPRRVEELAKALLQAQGDAKPLEKYQGPQRELDAMVKETMAAGEYDVIKEFARLRGGLFLDKRKDVNVFAEAVAKGNMTLLEHFASEVAVFESERRARRKAMGWSTLLGSACQRELPSLHIIETLVETIKVDVNTKFNLMAYSETGDTGTGPASEASSEAWDGPRCGTSTALHELASSRYFWQLEALGYVLDHGADIEARDGQGQTPLLKALACSGAGISYAGETVRLLLERGADVHAVCAHLRSWDRRDATSLDLARDATTIKLLLEHGMPVPVRDSVLLDAIERADTEAVKVLLEAGCDPEYIPPFRQIYCLHEASRSPWYTTTPSLSRSEAKVRKRDITKLLLEHGADPTARYGENSSVIHSVIEERSASIPLLDSPKMDVNLQGGPQNRSLLISACAPMVNPDELDDALMYDRDGILSTMDVAAMHALLDRGADPLLTDDGGRTALHWFSTISHRAMDDAHKDAFAALVERSGPGAVRAADNQGTTPLQLALAAHNAWTIRHLVSITGADPVLFGGGTTAADGSTALHQVAAHLVGEETGAQAAAELFGQLVALGLDVNARNAHGDTPALVLAATGWRGTKDPSPWPGRGPSAAPGWTYAKAHDVGYGPGIDLLAGLGADLRAVNKAGQGMLHLLAGRRMRRDDKDYDDEDQIYHVERAFKKLLDLGLDPRLEDGEMRTAIDLAVARGRRGIWSLFSDEGKGKLAWEDASIGCGERLLLGWEHHF